jgi:hypothetical protein
VQVLTNALKFTEKGKIEMTLRAADVNGGNFVNRRRRHRHRDQGPRTIRRLSPARRSSSVPAKHRAGLGHTQACHRASGTINLSSELGVGGVFSLVLPVNYSPTAQTQAGSEWPAHIDFEPMRRMVRWFPRKDQEARRLNCGD